VRRVCQRKSGHFRSSFLAAALTRGDFAAARRHARRFSSILAKVRRPRASPSPSASSLLARSQPFSEPPNCYVGMMNRDLCEACRYFDSIKSAARTPTPLPIEAGGDSSIRQRTYRIGEAVGFDPLLVFVNRGRQPAAPPSNHFELARLGTAARLARDIASGCAPYFPKAQRCSIVRSQSSLFEAAVLAQPLSRLHRKQPSPLRATLRTSAQKSPGPGSRSTPYLVRSRDRLSSRMGMYLDASPFIRIQAVPASIVQRPFPRLVRPDGIARFTFRSQEGAIGGVALSDRRHLLSFLPPLTIASTSGRSRMPQVLLREP